MKTIKTLTAATAFLAAITGAAAAQTYVDTYALGCSAGVAADCEKKREIDAYRAAQLAKICDQAAGNNAIYLDNLRHAAAREPQSYSPNQVKIETKIINEVYLSDCAGLAGGGHHD